MAEAKRKTGLRNPGEKTGDTLKLKDIRTGNVVHSPLADHFGKVGDWGLYGNDMYGTCGPTSVANQRKIVSKYLGGVEDSPTLDDVFDLYRRSGNPNFDPATDADDNGVIMQEMLNALLKDGIGKDANGNVRKPLAFAEVDVSDPDDVFAAIEIFGSILFGADLKQAQDKQTNEGLWDYVKGSREWGGHAFVGGRYKDASGTKSDRTGIVTWATVVDFTDAFRSHQVQEAWVVIWPENVGTVQFKEGIDGDALASAYQSLTGKPFPVVEPTPTPEPTPVPVDPGAGYAAADLAKDLRDLLTSKGL